MYEINDYKYTLCRCKGCGATVSVSGAQSTCLVVSKKFHDCPAYPDEKVLPLFEPIATSTEPFEADITTTKKSESDEEDEDEESLYYVAD